MRLHTLTLVSKEGLICHRLTSDWYKNLYDYKILASKH